MKVLVDTTGLNGQVKNPHYNKFAVNAYNDGHTTEYWDFDKSHPPLPLTEKQEPNTLVECEVVYQERKHALNHITGKAVWFNIDKERYDKTTDKFKRQVYKVIVPIKEESLSDDNDRTPYEEYLDAIIEFRKDHSSPLHKIEEGETVEQACERIIEHEVFEWDASAFRDGFHTGAQWQQSKSQQQVIELIRKRIESLQLAIKGNTYHLHLVAIWKSQKTILIELLTQLTNGK